MADLRTIRVTRYVTSLREGGSLPAIVEADDDWLYVVKFRGAGQGARALIAELVSGEIARGSCWWRIAATFAMIPTGSMRALCFATVPGSGKGGGD